MMKKNRRPQTITEKIIQRHCGQQAAFPGNFVEVNVDVVLANDITAPLAIQEFRKNFGARRVFDPRKVVLVMDHFTPNKDIRSAEQVKLVREFARQQKIVHYYEGGSCGIEHALLPELGIVGPGQLIIGADSHTCTYGALGAFASGVGSTDVAAIYATGKIWLKVPATIKIIYSGELNDYVGGKDLILYTIKQLGVDGARYQALEFSGRVIEQLSMDGRFTMANMAIEAGAKNGIVEPDEITAAYIRNRFFDRPTYLSSDQDAEYVRQIEIDCSKIKPQVARPFLPENSFDVDRLPKIKIDQVVIGSCTNGRIEDLRQAAEIFRHHPVHSDVRTIIIPATPGIYRQALAEGLLKVFLRAGAIISPPTCGPCLGGHMGILAAGERCVATTNRNFVGRMGHVKSEVYLANPYVAAASAVAGYIVEPKTVKKWKKKF